MTCPAGIHCHGSPDCTDTACPGHPGGAAPQGHGIFSLALTIALVSAIALSLGWVGPQIDTASSRATPESAVADSLSADAAQCRADHGPHAVAVHLPDGSHRCADKHGRRYRSQVTQVAAASGAGK